MNSSHAARHNAITAGYRPPQVSVNSSNRAAAAAGVGAVYTGLMSRAIWSQCCRAA